jgi:hypothetical protein
MYLEADEPAPSPPLKSVIVRIVLAEQYHCERDVIGKASYF